MGNLLVFPSRIRNGGAAAYPQKIKATERNLDAVVSSLGGMLNVMDQTVAELERLEAVFPTQRLKHQFGEKDLKILKKLVESAVTWCRIQIYQRLSRGN